MGLIFMKKIMKTSSIQTVLSVREFHPIVLTLADYTAGGESHPAPKFWFILFYR
jgi:hypothetical protein